MEQQPWKPNRRTSEYLSRLQGRLEQAKDLLGTRVYAVQEENGCIKLSIDNNQKILTLEISDALMESPDEQETNRRLSGILNRALLVASLDNMDEWRQLISADEWEDILSQEDQKIGENLAFCMGQADQVFHEMASLRKTYTSRSGMIKINMVGEQDYLEIEIREGYLTVKNKKRIEEEIKETFNRMMQERQDEMIGMLRDWESQIQQVTA